MLLEQNRANPNRDPRRPGFEAGDPGYGTPPYGRPSGLRRFLGGSPAGVFLRLLFLSVLVGAFMAMLGLTPGALVRNAYESAQALVHLAVSQLHDLTGWVVAGAVVVVPLWLIARLVAVSR